MNNDFIKLKRKEREEELKLLTFGEGEKRIVLFSEEEKGKRLLSDFYDGVVEAYEKNLPFYNVSFRLLYERISLTFAFGKGEDAVFAAKSGEAAAFFEIFSEKSGLFCYGGKENSERSEQIAVIFSAVSKLRRERIKPKTAAYLFAKQTGRLSFAAGTAGDDFSLSRLYEALCIFPELVR